MDKHVGELLSGFVDGELTHQERQRVTLHCERCDECQQNLSGLRALRERIGWLLFITGLLVLAGIGLIGFLVADGMSAGAKLILVAIYGGLALLLFSVLDSLLQTNSPVGGGSRHTSCT